MNLFNIMCHCALFGQLFELNLTLWHRVSVSLVKSGWSMLKYLTYL